MRWVALQAVRATAESAKKALQEAEALRGCEVTVHVSELDQQAAFGDGAGVLVVARTSHGCLLSGSAQVLFSHPSP